MISGATLGVAMMALACGGEGTETTTGSIVAVADIEVSDGSANQPSDNTVQSTTEDLTGAVDLTDGDPLKQAIARYAGKPANEVTPYAERVDFRQVRRTPDAYRGALFISPVEVTQVLDLGDGRTLLLVCQVESLEDLAAEWGDLSPSELQFFQNCTDWSSQATIVVDASALGRIFVEDTLIIVGIIESVQENELFEYTSAEETIIVSVLFAELQP